jgi:hypothetical protein
MVIESGSSAVLFSSQFVHARRPINATIIFDQSRQHLYLTTLTKVTTRRS